MSKRVQSRRGTTADHSTFTGQVGEVTVDTTLNTIRVHDGTTLSGHPLALASMLNVAANSITSTHIAPNSVSIVELNLSDGTAGQVLQTNGSGTMSFTNQPDVSASAVGGDISGTVGNAQIVANSVTVNELAVNEGSAGQALTTNGAGTLSFTTVVTDPNMGGDLSGTTSNAQIVANKVGITELNVNDGAAGTYLKTDGSGNLSFGAGSGLSSSSWAEDTFTGNGSTTTFTLSQNANVNGKSILVFVDGVNQPLASYTLPSQTSLVISPAPHTGAAIRILHLGIFSSGLTAGSSNFVEDIMTGNGSTTTFTFPSGTVAPTKESILVYVDGVAQQTSFYSLPSTTSIAFTGETPAAGTVIRVVHLGIASNLPGTTAGDILYYNGTAYTRLSAGTAGQHLATNSSANAPEWVDMYPTVPTGVIVMWSGTTSNIPTGWLLCDGQNSTPDLRDKFIVGAGSTYNPAATGGSTSTASHTLTVNEIPAHSHTFTYTAPAMNQPAPSFNQANNVGAPGAATSGTTNTGGGQGHTHANSLPPYLALAYIMKT